MTGFFREKLKTPFARRWAGGILFATVILFLSNPELLSAVLLVNMIGVDVFVLFIGIQLRQNWSVISAFIIVPCCIRVKKLFKVD
ncbi:TPA: hypothetical protein HH295_11590 [Xanthomonas vasicola pv. zeae]|uniref:Uncharacterized protein n=3 Tax=Xanthomonas vasicola TaxID=56459 RepID=A0A837APL8_XANVA|nr:MULTISPECIES: hypothetical protein [Xanthomonas]AVQ06820.1 hypothetical protein C7V42_09565 [Xanthomonas vasicola pv. vasculorum]AZM71023.1 hypothetical protein CXP37_09580 [Xanthomonas vasicola pv. vasculorum]KEZ97180.1 hypothetical protein A11M_0111765 [Xanthomonas vasicola pv. vasculorum NCPPB 895]KFA12600.1 hypothetical protein KWM_0103315 [Xanthomonas vasicola pv. musacearum NCPPB 2005]KFA30235.1 hypothetical protein KWG_0113630 [Xanthomonas vasicola pv. vasculorum NCPPB 1381]